MLSATAAWDQPSLGLGAVVSMRLRSGTPIEVDEGQLDELQQRPGAELVDFATGRVRPSQVWDVSASQRVWHRPSGGEARLAVAVLNLFDRPYAYNFGNPFSGTHFGARRALVASVHLER